MITGGLGGRFVRPDHIVYALSGVLFAVPFDPRRLEVTGAPAPFLEGVGRPLFGGAAPGTVYFSVAENGSLIYVPGPTVVTAGQASLTFVNKAGTLIPQQLPPGPYVHPRVSPNGQLLAFNTAGGRDVNVFIYDLAGTSSARQLTFSGRNRFPIWSPDGLRVAFQSDREGDLAVFAQRADGTGQAERLTKPEAGVSHVADSWSPDGNTLLFDAIQDQHAVLWMLALPDRKAARFSDVQSATATTSASFSHDGRWVAYTSGVISGGSSTGIFVQPFPPTGSKYRITAGLHPLWSRDDKEMSYVGRVGSGLQSVSILRQSSLTAGPPTPIAALSTGSGSSSPRNYDRTPDDERYVVFTQMGAGGTSAQRIQVVLNWSEELKARAPAK